MQAAEVASQVLMVRQPIFGADLRIIAYELLIEGNDDPALNASAGTSEVLLNTYTSFCEDGVIRRVPLFISLSQQVLQKGQIPDLPKKQLVLQIPASTQINARVFGNIQMLAEQGYRLALTGFSLQQQFIPLLKYMAIIKLDVRELSNTRLSKLVPLLSRSKAKLLAQNVDSVTQLQRCRKMGFRLLQGPFLSRPVQIRGKRLPGNSLALLQLLQELQKPSTTADAIEELIILDPVLTYKILRIVNSAACGLSNRIESLSQAVVLLGLDQVRKWATLIALSSDDDKPEELSRNMLVRGRLCLLLAEQRGDLNPESAFMVGILSQLDALMEMAMDELLEQIPLDEEIKSAIGSHQGMLGEILSQVICYEAGDWERLRSLSADCGFIEAAYRHSLVWAQYTMRTLNED